MCASAYLTAEICLTLLPQSLPLNTTLLYQRNSTIAEELLVRMCVCFWEHLGFVTQTFFLVKRLLISLELLVTGWCIHEYLHLLRWTTSLPFLPTTQMVPFTSEDTIVSGFLRHVLTVGVWCIQHARLYTNPECASNNDRPLSLERTHLSLSV